jgi:cob(I)alamin adenosyltransferase
MAGERHGLVLVLTGDGKGKTTAALGQAMRAIGHGRRVLMVQFMKGDGRYGELRAAKHLPGLKIVQSGLPTFVKRGEPGADDVRLAREGLGVVAEALAGRRYDLLILDEVNVAIDYGLLPVDEVLALLRARPAEVDVVLTGRAAHPRVVEFADTVSEVRSLKHHYEAGVPARAGIEY